MRDALALAIKNYGIFAGQIYNVADHLLTFADSDPSKRTTHHVRPVLVVQGDDHGQNAQCQTVLVMPLSSQAPNQRPWEDFLAQSESPLGSGSIVKAHLIQPVSRDAIEKSILQGTVPEDALARVLAHLMMNLGLLD